MVKPSCPLGYLSMPADPLGKLCEMGLPFKIRCLGGLHGREKKGGGLELFAELESRRGAARGGRGGWHVNPAASVWPGGSLKEERQAAETPGRSHLRLQVGPPNGSCSEERAPLHVYWRVVSPCQENRSLAVAGGGSGGMGRF